MDTSGKLAPGFNEGGKMARTLERATTGAHSLIDKVTDAAHPALDRISSGAHRSVFRAADAATHTAAAFSVKREQFRHARVRTMEETRDYVRANPILSISIAVAAGYLINRLLRSRKA